MRKSTAPVSKSLPLAALALAALSEACARRVASSSRSRCSRATDSNIAARPRRPAEVFLESSALKEEPGLAGLPLLDEVFAPSLLDPGSRTSSGSIRDAGTSSKMPSACVGASNPTVTCAVPNELTIHTDAGLPPPPPLSHTSLGCDCGAQVQDVGTQRRDSSGGGALLPLSTMPSALKPGGGTAAHAYAAVCRHSWPHTCRNRTGCGNSASITFGMCVEPVMDHALASAISSAFAG